jgi:uroporphyrinogen decarboxylase
VLEGSGGHAFPACGIERAPHLPGDLVLADGDGIQTRRDREQVLRHVVAVRELDGLADVAEGQRRQLGEALHRGIHRRQRRRVVGTVGEIEVGLEPVAGRQDDGSADALVRRREVGRDGVSDHRQSLQRLERGGALMGGEADEHAGPVVNRTEGNEVSITINAHSSPSHGSIIITSATAAAHPLTAHGTSASRLVRALRGDRPEITPVWFMRQAGRSLPEYRALRATGTMLDACLSPELASEITMQPVRRHGVDAAVFFSDIVVPLHLVGVEVEIAAGRSRLPQPGAHGGGDRHARADRPGARGGARRGRRRRRTAHRRDAGGGGRAARRAAAAHRLRRGPFTLAAYLVEGGPSKDHLGARSLIHSDPAAWADLTAWLAEVTGRFLALQVRAGASAAQLFDSWAGALAPTDYRRAVLPASAAALEPVRAVRSGGPRRTSHPFRRRHR